MQALVKTRESGKAAFTKKYYMARVLTSSPIFSMNSSRLITWVSPVFRLRTATWSLSASLSPSTSI